MKWMLARQRKKGQSAELNQVLVQEGLCASLGSLMTVTGQLSNRKGSNQICNSVEDGSGPERLEKGRPTRDHIILQATVYGRTEPRQDRHRREWM